MIKLEGWKFTLLIVLVVYVLVLQSICFDSKESGPGYSKANISTLYLQRGSHCQVNGICSLLSPIIKKFASNEPINYPKNNARTKYYCPMTAGVRYIDIAHNNCAHYKITPESAGTINALGLEKDGQNQSYDEIAVVDQAKCTLCKTCVEACPSGAITIIDGRLVINPDECVSCGICVEECPEEAITLD